MPRPYRAALALACFCVGLVPVTGSADDSKVTAEQARFFESKIRPILVERCVSCHGAEKQKAGLRLDTSEAFAAGGDTGEAVVAGKPDESLLIAAIRYNDDGPKMPPSKQLPPAEIEALTQWVQLGAPWPADSEPSTTPVRKGPMTVTDKDREHWSFQPTNPGAVPKVSNPTWVANPVDAFILAKLETKGLKPNPQASKTELIRRATYDLTGLPPTPEEVEAFLADTSSNAYRDLIDRLLASPRYGEKWGRHWLDLVRYAETNSYERDNPKPSAWRYRDYVIRAFNDDKPYDRFIREQLAGDELPDASNDSRIATGFYRLGIWDDEPTDRLQAQFDMLDDIVATTGQVFLGLTVDCARCHDHKIDPIPQKDYYKLVSIFRNINHFRNGGPTDEVNFIEEGKERDYEARARDLARQREEVRESIAEIEEEFRKTYEASNMSDKSDLEELRFKFYRDTWDKLPNFDTLKPETTGELAAGFDLSPRSRDSAIGFVFEGLLNVPETGEYTFSLDSDDGSRLMVNGQEVLLYDGNHSLGKPQTAKVKLTQGRLPIRLDYFQGGGGLGLKAEWSGPGFTRSLMAEKIAKPKADIPALVREQGAKVLGKERHERYLTLIQKNQELRGKQVATETILCVTEAGRTAPETHVMLRGNPHVLGDKVEPGFLEVIDRGTLELPEPPSEAKTTGRRLALANWIASPTNPLTARVMVNRIFQHHFGRGIVRSPSNYGSQGDKPTHPELLDWLAQELVAKGWHLKAIHKLLMTSNTYQMSSRGNEQALAVDPINDLLWRYDMRRLTAEEIRDSILSVSGNLNPGMYGPGIYPEIPAEVLAGQSIPGRGWGKSSPEEQARRSIYIHAKRSLLMPILEGFDQAETDRSSPVRFSTTQPTQALGMINGAFLQAQARLLAERLERDAGSDLATQVRLAIKLTTARDAQPEEVERGVAFINTLISRENLSRDQARGFFALLALNMNEFLFLD